VFLSSETDGVYLVVYSLMTSRSQNGPVVRVENVRDLLDVVVLFREFILNLLDLVLKDL